MPDGEGMLEMLYRLAMTPMPELGRVVPPYQMPSLLEMLQKLPDAPGPPARPGWWPVGPSTQSAPPGPGMTGVRG